MFNVKLACMGNGCSTVCPGDVFDGVLFCDVLFPRRCLG